MYIFDFRLKIFWSYIDTLGGPCLRDRLQDLYDRRTGDPLWDLCELGTRNGEIFLEILGKFGSYTVERSLRMLLYFTIFQQKSP